MLCVKLSDDGFELFIPILRYDVLNEGKIKIEQISNKEIKVLFIIYTY
jgi:hypothetical protein